MRETQEADAVLVLGCPVRAACTLAMVEEVAPNAWRRVTIEEICWLVSEEAEARDGSVKAVKARTAPRVASFLSMRERVRWLGGYE